MRWRPTPSLVLSIVAVVLAAAGTSVAAINYARNAGAVDGKSAVWASSSLARAAGKLVTTKASGPLKGRIPARFLDLSGVVAGAKSTFHQSLEVVDNSTGAPVTIGGLPGLGALTVTCSDQNDKAGVENPRASFSFANTSGQTLNYDRQVGGAATTVIALANGTQDAFAINNSDTFRVHAETAAGNYVVEGAMRQDGQGTPAGLCQLYGYALYVPA